MGSGIILIKAYITEPTFEHYFEPIFKKNIIDITDRHFFGKLHSEESALIALRGDLNKKIIYDVMERGTIIAKKDNEENNLDKIHGSQKPKWYHFCPSLIDKNPDIIGIYNDNETASRFFGNVGLEYIAKETEEKVLKSIENIEHELKAIGKKFYNF
jgi:hypothetical protein